MENDTERIGDLPFPFYPLSLTITTLGLVGNALIIVTETDVKREVENKLEGESLQCITARCAHFTSNNSRLA